jgi:3-phosphoshikimate 1-carboxyvinyltransferase
MIKTIVLAPKKGLNGAIVVPPSKSYTHRAVIMASLANGSSKINNALISRDTNATIAACKAIGAEIENNHSGLIVKGARPQTPNDVIDVENSGTTLRFMTSILSLADDGYSILTGDASIRRRPMEPLLKALGELGVQAWSSRANGCAPIIVKGGGINGGKVTMKGDVSSQFVSSLLISAPKANGEVVLKISKAVSRPYIDATLTLLERFGIKIKRRGYDEYMIPSKQEYKSTDLTIPADFSSASFIMAAVALLGGDVELKNLDPTLPQGDSLIMEILNSMGLNVREGRHSIYVSSDGGKLKGRRFNLSDTPDLLPVVSVLALGCDSQVEITGVAHARFKETDRIAVLANELSKLGAKIEERRDGLKLYPPRKLSPSLLDAHDDHRMFMAFSLASMLIEGGTPIIGVESLDVSYPSFLSDLRNLGASVKKG